MVPVVEMLKGLRISGGAARYVWVATALLCLAVVPAGALTLTDGVGTLTVNDGDGSLTQYQANDPNDLFAAAYFYRTTAMTAEASMLGQGADPLISSVSQVAPDTIQVVGSVATFDYTMDYVLAGSFLTSTLTLTDTTGANQSVALFSYQDWDLGAAGDDLASWDGTTLTLSDPILTRTVEIQAVTAAIAAEASNFGPLLASLTDASVTTLTDGNGLPFGPGDVTYALEYDVLVPANGQVSVVTTYSLQSNVVPEPGTGSLTALGLLTLALRRRRSLHRAA